MVGYVAGDLERHYPTLGIEEDFFVNYGFLSAEHHALMHPRSRRGRAGRRRRATRRDAVLAFVRERGTVHPREVDSHFKHGKVTNWFGGSSNASTELLDGMHYRGLLRVARRDAGTRVYAARDPWPVVNDRAQIRSRMDTMVDLIVATYAPLPSSTLSQLVHWLRLAAPQWAADRPRALTHAKKRLGHARVDGIDWYWPANEDPAAAQALQDDRVWLLAPFDPVVWDRRRFERFWGWPYRFEAYTPAPKRKLGHYALPLLWRERVVGWANVSGRVGRDAARGWLLRPAHQRAGVRARGRRRVASPAPLSRPRAVCRRCRGEFGRRKRRTTDRSVWDSWLIWARPSANAACGQQRIGHFGEAGAAFAARQIGGPHGQLIGEAHQVGHPTLNGKRANISWSLVESPT